MTNKIKTLSKTNQEKRKKTPTTNIKWEWNITTNPTDITKIKRKGYEEELYANQAIYVKWQTSFKTQFTETETRRNRKSD